MKEMTLLPLPPGEGRGEGSREDMPAHLAALSPTLSQGEREKK